MLQRGMLLLIVACFAGCAYLEGPRWALLGDTKQEAFFIDRQEVKRLANGNYLYTLKACRYLDDKVHEHDPARDTNRVIYIELNCRDRQWQETGRGVTDMSDQPLFHYLNPSPSRNPIEPGTIQQSAYDYLCGNQSITPRHLH